MSNTECEYAIGIDLGTNLSVVGIWDNNTKNVKIIENEYGNRLTPSCVAFDEEGNRLIGESAKKYGLINSTNFFYETKRLMGKLLTDINENHFNYQLTDDMYGKVQIKLENGKCIYPEEIAGSILYKMKSIAEKYLNKTVNNAVITVPAYFNDAQRNATKNAALLAGLNCIRIINEPTAACLCYGLNTKDNITVLVYDLGGGTLDVSLLELNDGVFQVIAVSGDDCLGGKDFDDLLTQYIINVFQEKTGIKLHNRYYNKIKNMAELAKKELSSMQYTVIDCDFESTYYQIKLTRKQFETISDDLFKRCMIPVEQVLDDSGIDIKSINEIVLVGGSSRIPKIQQLLSSKFHGKQLNQGINPDEAVAFGAAIQGAILTNSDNTGITKDLVLIDVIPLSLGIKVQGGIMNKIIPKNTPIPTSKTDVFTTAENNQTYVNIEIYEGERAFVKDNNLLGKYVLSNLPKMPPGQLKIFVTYDVNTDGILKVSSSSNNVSESITIDRTEHLSTDNIKYMLETAEQYRLKDQIALKQLEATNDLIEFINKNYRLVNDPDANLPKDIKENINQLFLKTLHWLEEDDDNNRPNPQNIIECKLALQYNIDSLPWAESYYEMHGIKYDKDSSNELNTVNENSLNELVNTLKCE